MTKVRKSADGNVNDSKLENELLCLARENREAQKQRVVCLRVEACCGSREQLVAHPACPNTTKKGI